MTTFPVHSSETAPQASQPVLAAAQRKFGFVPNLFRVMAEAPAAGQAYMAVMDIFESSSLSNAEKQTVLLSASFVNQCDYCMRITLLLPPAIPLGTGVVQTEAHRSGSL